VLAPPTLRTPNCRSATTTIGQFMAWFKKEPADAPPADVKKVYPDLIRYF
jgi:hypothetical protein